MSDIAIRVENLSKRYRIGGPQARYKTIRESLTEAVGAPFRRLSSVVRGQSSAVSNETIWALKDVSFEVQRGEVVGIIGRNGSGKTTLLKILSRITEPTEGYAEIHGRVGSLLEVGTGFHLELTGRENIYLNGAILGMKRTEIDRKFDEIVAFSGVEKFIDTPVKHYSSGMYVRLAFAVAAHLEPEILLIDEVLAVGDAAFQKKCLRKMGDVAKEGRTVLFVSHNMQAIVKLCQRCILLQDGKVYEDALSTKVVADYLGGSRYVSGERVWHPEEYVPGDKEFIRYRTVRMINSEGKLTGAVYIDEPFWIEIEYEVMQTLTKAWLGFAMNTTRGEVIFCSGDENFELPERLVRSPGIYKSRCKIPGNLLNQDSYSISLLGHIPGIRILVDEDSVLGFEALQRQDIAGPGRQPGLIRPLLSWTVERIG